MMEFLTVNFGTEIASFAAFGAFVLAALAIYFMGAYRSDEVSRRMRQIQKPASGSRKTPESTQEGAYVVHWLKPAGELILPQKEWRRSALKRQLVFAGYRDTKALYIFLGIKLVAALAFAFAAAVGAVIVSGFLFLFQPLSIVILMASGFVGFILPDLMVQQKIKRRRLEFTESFPDAMDMLVVCVEAGLGLDAAIQRVAKELRYGHPALATELSLNALEVRAGKTRQEAFRSLAERMNIDQVHALASILIQAERYGTGVGKALRTFAEEMRVERIQRAKETAAKLPVKMIFPIIVFIFPALFLVLLGPAIIRITTGFASI